MNLRQLEVFRAVMRCRSATDAARMLNVSQPAVSKIIRHTERQLGFDLFRRRGGRLEPSVEAEALYREAERLFQEMDALRRLSGDLVSGMVGMFRLGASASLALSVAARAISMFRAEFPGIKMISRLGSGAELSEMMLSRQIELALSLAPLNVPNIHSESIADVDIVCIFPRGHPLSDLPEINPRHLIGSKLVSFSSSSWVGSLLDAAFKKDGMVRKIDIEIDLSLSACALVQQGAGVALVDALVPPLGFPGIDWRPFRPRVKLDLLLVHPKEESNFRDRFVPLVRQAIAENRITAISGVSTNETIRA